DRAEETPGTAGRDRGFQNEDRVGIPDQELCDASLQAGKRRANRRGNRKCGQRNEWRDRRLPESLPDADGAEDRGIEHLAAAFKSAALYSGAILREVNFAGICENICGNLRETRFHANKGFAKNTVCHILDIYKL